MDGFTTAACRHHPFLLRIAQIIPAMDIQIRKDTMTILRTQQNPLRNQFLHDRIDGTLSSYIYATISRRPVTLQYKADFLPSLLTIIHSPLYCGFISALLRCTPYDDESKALATIEIGIRKELDVALSPDRPSTIDYGPFFGPDTTLPLHQTIPDRLDVHAMIRWRLSLWKVKHPLLRSMLPSSLLYDRTPCAAAHYIRLSNA
jgi:hypothetical protein